MRSPFRFFAPRTARGATCFAAALLAVLVPFAAMADLRKGLEYFEMRNYEAAFKELGPLAEQGNAEAQYRVGRMYYYGWGVAKNDAQAVTWWRKAAGQGDRRAQKMLAFMLREGIGTAKDPAEADKWERSSAAPGASGSGARLPARRSGPVQPKWPSDRAVNAAYCVGMYTRAMQRSAGYHPIFLPSSRSAEDQRAAQRAEQSMMSWSFRVQELAARTAAELELGWLTGFTRDEIESALEGKPPAAGERLHGAELAMFEAQVEQFGWIGALGGNALEAKTRACTSPCMKEPFARQAACVMSCLDAELERQGERCDDPHAPAFVRKQDVEDYLSRLFAPLLRLPKG